MVDEIKLIQFSKQDMKAACDSFTTNLQADNLASWIEVGEETLMMQHLSEEDIAASVKNRKTTVNFEPVSREMTQKIMVLIPMK
jgi:hypothetical protein